ncbi:MAG: efflux RND transporter periplasmic adaptor subunit [Polyangia bacterium]
MGECRSERFVLFRMLATALVAVGSTAVACKEGDSAERNSEQRIAVQVMKARVETVEGTRRIAGDVAPSEVLPLSFKVGGRVVELFVDEGDEVEKGDRVALLDPRDYRLQRELASARVKGLEPQLERAEKLAESGAVTPAELDELRSRMEAAEIQRSQAATQLSYSRLEAPIPGVVLERRVAPGDMVGPSRPVVVLADLDRVEIELPVSQRDLSLFSEGQRVEFGTVGLERRMSGEVRSVGLAANETTRTFPVKLLADNPQRLLRAGMIVEAEVPLPGREGVFLPLDLVRRDELGRTRVLVAVAGGERAEAREVRLGDLLGGRVRVLDGIHPGDRVIVRGMAGDGDSIEIVDELEAGGGGAGDE